MRVRAFTAVLALAIGSVASAKPVITPDVVYGHKAGMALTYDVVQPDDHNGAAVLFMVSGGWFSNWRPPEERLPWFEHLLSAGFTVFAVHHGSAPRFKVPEAVTDVRKAVEHVRANAERFDIDAGRLGVHGGSAGGHLSLMLGLAPEGGNRVQAVVAYFPPVDLEGMAGPSDRFPALDFDPELASGISPINYASDDDPPVLLIHGDLDELVPLSNSERMSAALDGVGVTNKVVVIEGAKHGFRGEAQQRAREETVAFFKQHLGAK